METEAATFYQSARRLTPDLSLHTDTINHTNTLMLQGTGTHASLYGALTPSSCYTETQSSNQESQIQSYADDVDNFEIKTDAGRHAKQ
jgi:hypothetical protein